jgi:TPR repeat protein
LLFNLTFFTIHPDLKRQNGDFSQHVKNAIFTLKDPYQVKKIGTARDRNRPIHVNGLEKSSGDDYNLKWCTRAAKQGYMSAQNNLGWLYSKSTIQFHNETKAYMWWFIAAQNGSRKALENMVRMETRLASDTISKAQNMAEKCLQSNYPKQLSDL